MADDWASAPIVGEVVDEFERATGADGPGAERPVLADPRSGPVRGGARQPHDVVHWHAFAAAAAGLAQPVDDLWGDAGLTAEEYVPGALEDVTWDGQRFGVPLDINALVLMVNAASFERAGPRARGRRDPAGVRAAAEQVVSSGASEYAITVSASSWAAYGWIVANGGQLLTRDADGQVTSSRSTTRRTWRRWNSSPSSSRRSARRDRSRRTSRSRRSSRSPTGRPPCTPRLLGPADRAARGAGGGRPRGHPYPAAAAGRPGAIRGRCSAARACSSPRTRPTVTPRSS
jgi:hypothetical protein